MTELKQDFVQWFDAIMSEFGSSGINSIVVMSSIIGERINEKFSNEQIHELMIMAYGPFIPKTEASLLLQEQEVKKMEE